MEKEEVMHAEGNAIDLFSAVGKNWQATLVFLSFFASIVGGWAHFQARGTDLMEKYSTVQAQILTANVNYATLSGNLQAANAKLDILLKANNLQ